MNFRLDRFLTLYLFGPLSRLRKPKGLRIPILMYHSISDGRENRHPYYWINTSPARFAEHMKYLHDNNYQVIPLAEAVEMIRSQSSVSSYTDPVPNLWPAARSRLQPSKPGTQHSTLNTAVDSHLQPATCNLQSCSSPDPRPPTPGLSPSSPVHQFTSSPSAPTRYVVLTFDDGYLDFYTQAFPVLQRYAFTATVFLPVSFIKNERSFFKGKASMVWEEVRQLGDEGVIFGSHTLNHRQLKELTEQEIDDEIRSSKVIIEDQTGIPVHSFSYPFAFPQEDQDLVRFYERKLPEYGYVTAVTTMIGRADINNNPLMLRRIPVNNADDKVFFQLKVEGAYDWMHKCQYLYKLSRKGFRIYE